MRFLPSRSAAIALALAAMALRALLPDGWMPSAHAAPFTICSVNVQSHGSGKPSQPEQEHRHAPCAFAAAAPLAPPATAVLVFATSSPAVAVPTDFSDSPAPSSSR